MGAIGGIVDFRNCNIDFSVFNSMRRAETLRGRKGSVAYLDSGVGMFYNSDEIFKSEQPIISKRRGYNTSLVIDSPLFDGRLALEGYRAYGVEFVGMLDISFALALYDSERRMLLLARDKKGKKPLYYTLKEGKVYFSSEAKGILEIRKQSVNVNRQILSAHLTSPIGIYGAADIYTDVFEVRCGECILFTDLGMSKFFYRENSHKKITSKASLKFNERAVEPFFEVDRDIVLSSLEDSLIAFDIPQFDSYMPSLCQLFSKADKEQNKVFQFKDLQKRQSLSYSYEREDRLSAFYGKAGVGVMVKGDESEYENIGNEKIKLVQILTDAFFSIDRNGMLLLRKIFGDAKMNYLLCIFDKNFENKKRKEDTEFIIRILGMIYQTIELSKLRELEFLPEEKKMYSYVSNNN